MIQDMDETLRQILVKKGKLSGGDIDISFDQPTGQWAGSLTRPTVNGYLYDIRENVELRSRDFRVERENGIARRVMDPTRIDLSYIFTVWTRSIEDEHRLIWQVLHILSQQRILKPADAQGALVRQPMDMPIKVALPSDAIRNLPDLWGVMENQLRPAINFVITVALDLGETYELPIVTTTQIDVGQYNMGEPRTFRSNVNAVNAGKGVDKVSVATAIDLIYHVGGVVYHGSDPVPKATITVKDHALEVVSDPAGYYVFASIPPGPYTLQVQAAGQKPQNHKITVPSKNYDLKLKGSE